MDNITANIERAIKLLECGKYADVVKQLTPINQQVPDNDEILVLLAEALSETKRSKQVIELLQRRALHPDVAPDVIFSLGDELFAVGNIELALECYHRLLNIDDCAAEGWVRIGLVYVAQDDLDAAERSFLNSLKCESSNPSALNSLGDLAMERQQSAVAKEWFQQAVAVDAEDPEAWGNLAELYYDDGDLENAQRCAEKSTASDDIYAPAWLTLGYIALDQDDEQQVRQCFNKFLALEDGVGAEDIVIEVKAVLAALKD